MPRNLTPVEVEEVTTQVRVGLTVGLGLSDVTLVGSIAWYREQFDICGNWDSWIWETVTGRDYATRAEHFAGFVVAGDRLGRAGAGIVDLALRQGRLVLLWRANAPLQSVRSVVPVDMSDMTSGWTVGATSDIGVSV